MSKPMPQRWQAFHDYLVEPYAGNRPARDEMHGWFNDLYSHPHRHLLDLTFVEARSAARGERFEAFCLNRQIFFSSAAAVMTVPHATAPDRPYHPFFAPNHRVGVWLHDMGDHGLAHQQAEKIFGRMHMHDNERSCAITSAHHPLRFVQRQIGFALAPYMANVHAELGDGETRLAKLSIDLMTHADIAWVKSEEEEGWTRTVIYPYSRRGTNYVLHKPPGKQWTAEGQNISEIILRAPTYAAAAHFAARAVEKPKPTPEKLGALHHAQCHRQGRAIVIFSDLDPGRVFYPFSDTGPAWNVKAIRGSKKPDGLALPERRFPADSEFAALARRLRDRSP